MPATEPALRKFGDNVRSRREKQDLSSPSPLCILRSLGEGGSLPAVSLSNRSSGLDGRSGARVRELDFDLMPVPVSTRTSKGLLVTKWAVKEVKRNDLALK